MCVALVINSDTGISFDDLKRMNEDNPHGAGVAYWDQSMIRIRKGLTVEEIAWLQPDMPRPFLLHFRWATVGPKVPRLAHPFALGREAFSDKLDQLVRSAFIHNGGWSKWREWQLPEGVKDTDVSDTQVAAFVIGAGHPEVIKDVDWSNAIIRLGRGRPIVETHGRWMDVPGSSGQDKCSNLSWQGRARGVIVPYGGRQSYWDSDDTDSGYRVTSNTGDQSLPCKECYHFVAHAPGCRFVGGTAVISRERMTETEYKAYKAKRAQPVVPLSSATNANTYNRTGGNALLGPLIPARVYDTKQMKWIDAPLTTNAPLPARTGTVATNAPAMPLMAGIVPVGVHSGAPANTTTPPTNPPTDSASALAVAKQLSHVTPHDSSRSWSQVYDGPTIGSGNASGRTFKTTYSYRNPARLGDHPCSVCLWFACICGYSVEIALSIDKARKSGVMSDYGRPIARGDFPDSRKRGSDSGGDMRERLVNATDVHLLNQGIEPSRLMARAPVSSGMFPAPIVVSEYTPVACVPIELTPLNGDTPEMEAVKRTAKVTYFGTNATQNKRERNDRRNRRKTIRKDARDLARKAINDEIAIAVLRDGERKVREAGLADPTDTTHTTRERALVEWRKRERERTAIERTPTITIDENDEVTYCAPESIGTGTVVAHAWEDTARMAKADASAVVALIDERDLSTDAQCAVDCSDTPAIKRAPQPAHPAHPVHRSAPVLHGRFNGMRPLALAPDVDPCKVTPSMMGKTEQTRGCYLDPMMEEVQLALAGIDQETDARVVDYHADDGAIADDMYDDFLIENGGEG